MKQRTKQRQITWSSGKKSRNTLKVIILDNENAPLFFAKAGIYDSAATKDHSSKKKIGLISMKNTLSKKNSISVPTHDIFPPSEMNCGTISAMLFS